MFACVSVLGMFLGGINMFLMDLLCIHGLSTKFRKSVIRPHFFRVRFSGVRQIPVQEFLCNKIPVYHFPVGIFASVVFSGVTFPVGEDFRCKVPVKEKCQ